MADCEHNCLDQGDCQQNFDGQAYNWTTRTGAFLYQDDCGNKSQSYWNQAINLLPDKHGDEDYNQFPATGRKHCFLNGWLEDTPGHVLDEENCNHHCSRTGESETDTNCNCGLYGNNCKYEDYYRVIPERCDFAVQHPGPNSHRSSDKDYIIQPQNPNPEEDNDSESGNGVEDIIIPAVTAAASSLHPVASAGAALALQWIDNQSFDPSNEVYYVPIDDTHHRWMWELPLSATHQDQLPDSPCNSSSIRFRIEGNSGEHTGKEQQLNCYYRNTYTFRKYMEDTINCSDNSWACNEVYEYTRTSGPVVEEFNFELYDSTA